MEHFSCPRQVHALLIGLAAVVSAGGASVPPGLDASGVFRPTPSSTLAPHEANRIRRYQEWSPDQPHPTVLLSGQYVRERTMSATVVGENLDKISAMAILLDRSNQKNPRTTMNLFKDIPEEEWQPFQNRFSFDLEEGNGERAVWFLYKDLAGRINFSRLRIWVDNTPPEIRVVNPASTKLSIPVIQLKATSPEELAKVTLDLENADGRIAGRDGYMSDHNFDPAERRVTQTTFNFNDVPLAKGENRVTIHATDRAGNTSHTPLTFVFATDDDFEAPRFSVIWPTDETRVNGKNFRLFGEVDDPTAEIRVITSRGKTFIGGNSREGLVWVQNVPLEQDESFFTITATDAAGNQASQTLVVKRSDVEIVMDLAGKTATLVPEGETVTGSISKPGYTV